MNLSLLDDAAAAQRRIDVLLKAHPDLLNAYERTGRTPIEKACVTLYARLAAERDALIISAAEESPNE